VATDDEIQQRLGEAREDEAVKERLEREHGELLEELRALIPGAQVLFGFLPAIRFTSPFTDLSTVQRDVYHATLLTTAGEPGSDRRDGRHRPGLHRCARGCGNPACST
jgi:hypothetical protein